MDKTKTTNLFQELPKELRLALMQFNITNISIDGDTLKIESEKAMHVSWAKAIQDDLNELGNKTESVSFKANF
jgi:hypothetical protein